MKVTIPFVRFQADIGNQIVILESLLDVLHSFQDVFPRSFRLAYL